MVQIFVFALVVIATIPAGAAYRTVYDMAIEKNPTVGVELQCAAALKEVRHSVLESDKCRDCQPQGEFLYHLAKKSDSGDWDMCLIEDSNYRCFPVPKPKASDGGIAIVKLNPEGRYIWLQAEKEGVVPAYRVRGVVSSQRDKFDKKAAVDAANSIVKSQASIELDRFAGIEPLVTKVAAKYDVKASVKTEKWGIWKNRYSVELEGPRDKVTDFWYAVANNLEINEEPADDLQKIRSKGSAEFQAMVADRRQLAAAAEEEMKRNAVPVTPRTVPAHELKATLKERTVAQLKAFAQENVKFPSPSMYKFNRCESFVRENPELQSAYCDNFETCNFKSAPGDSKSGSAPGKGVQ